MGFICEGIRKYIKRCLDCFMEYDDSFGGVCSHCGYNNDFIETDGNHLRRGTLLDRGRYIIGEALNSGGFGVVYRAFDTKLEIIVAIKEYFPGNLSTRIPGTSEVISLTGNKREHYLQGKDNFIYEARILMKFDHHEHIVNCMNYFEENNTAYIVMEYLEGCSVKQFIAMNTLDISAVNDIASAIMDALTSIHEAGFVFRDVAPDNIFICNNGNIKLIDFGAAIAIGSKIDGMVEDTIIKPGYAPIEQYASDGKLGPYTDIYALGATLYRILSGKVPFESTDRAIYDDLPILKEIDANIPEYMDKAIMKAMAVQPNLRFSTIEEMRKAFQNEKEIPYMADYIRKRKRIKRLVFVGLGGLCLLLVGIVYYIAQRNNDGIKNIKVAEETIEVMLPYAKEEDQQYLEAIVQDFQNTYPQIHINLQMIPASEYDSAIERASDLPNVFINHQTINNDRLGNMQELLTSLDKEGYFAFSKVDEDVLKYQIPLSFEASVCFINTNLIKDVQNTVAIDDVIKTYALAYNPAFYLTIKDAEQAEDTYAAYKEKLVTKEMFLSEEVPYYVGSTAEWDEIAERMAGYWDACTYSDTTAVLFHDAVSIKKEASENEKNASMLFVYALLSDSAQNRMFIQIDSDYIPVNTDTLDMYQNYRQLDFLDESDHIYVYTQEDLQKNAELMQTSQ